MIKKKIWLFTKKDFGCVTLWSDGIELVTCELCTCKLNEKVKKILILKLTRLLNIVYFMPFFIKYTNSLWVSFDHMCEIRVWWS